MIPVARPASLRGLFIGYGAPSIALLVYAFDWLLFLHGPPGAYQALVNGLGIHATPYPFVDTESVLVAIDCARQGVEVTLPNACMGGGIFIFSPLLLKASALQLGAAQRVPLGLSLDGLFLLSLFALPRPRRWREFWLLLLAALSSGSLFAIERANIDIAIYLLVLGTSHLLLRGAGPRAAAYATLLGAAAIKFYPACLLLLAARERPARFLTICVVSLIAAFLLIVMFGDGIGHAITRLPQGDPFTGLFSASRLPLGLAMLANNRDADHGVGLAIWAASGICLIGIGTVLVRHLVPTILPEFRALGLREQVVLVAGSVLIVFCFFVAKNFDYRSIFLILTLPGLWALERGARNRAIGKRFRFAAWVVVGLLWSEFFRATARSLAVAWFSGNAEALIQIGVWVLHELLWWWLVSLLLSFSLCFLWDAPIMLWLRRRGLSHSLVEIEVEQM